MLLLLLNCAAAGLIFVISFLAGLAPLKHKRLQEHSNWLRAAEAGASGIFLGAALFHMLPAAQTSFQQALGNVSYPYANLLCAFGFVTLLFLEKINLHSTSKPSSTNNKLPLVLAIVLSIHAFTEGAAVGVNSVVANAFIISVAILAHKGSESFALAVNLAQSHLSTTAKWKIFFLFTLMTPLGIGIGALTKGFLIGNSGQIAEASFNAFAAGTFLYIATLHQLQHPHDASHCDHFQELIATVIGLSLMAILAIWV
jgi:zinc transporter ZupT